MLFKVRILNMLFSSFHFVISFLYIYIWYTAGAFTIWQWSKLLRSLACAWGRGRAGSCRPFPCVLGMLWWPGELPSCSHSRRNEAASAFPSVAGLPHQGYVKETRLLVCFYQVSNPNRKLALDEHLLQTAILGPSWQVTLLTCKFPLHLLQQSHSYPF